MKILLLSPWFPWPPYGGALIRVRETLRFLARRHRVTLVAPIDPANAPDPGAVADLCEAVVAVPVSETPRAALGRMARGLGRGMPLIQGLHHDPALGRAVHRLTAREVFDVIHVEHSFMAPYLRHVAGASRAKRVLSMHNLESLRFRRELETMRWSPRRLALWIDSVVFGSWEQHAVQQFDGITTVSVLEEDWIRKHAPNARTAVVPNGVDTTHFSAGPETPRPRTVVFPGLMNYPPNIDAVVWFCNAVLPAVAARCPDVRFLIVGDKPTPDVLALAERPNIQVTGRVPDVRPYLAECAAVVVPVRSGAGTRLKILEAMAMGRPVVSTIQGAEGLSATHGVDILLGDTPQRLANHVADALESPELRARIGAAGRRLVEQEYDWGRCFRNLEQLYEAITGSGCSRALNAVEEFAS
jgi:sugar transferase (PEP-CTERM/EpsH1 system associated)